MTFTEEQKVFIKEKINKTLPGSRIYLFCNMDSPHGNPDGTDLYVIAEREPTPREKKDILSALWMVLGSKNLNLAYHRNNLESVPKEVRYALVEGIEL